MYDINTKNVKKGKGFYFSFLCVGLLFGVILGACLVSNFDYMLLICMLIPLVFIIISSVNIHKISKRVKLIKELNTNGKLIKNLPYRLENTGMSVNGVQIQRPVVDYTLPSGSMITLYGDPRHDRKIADADGLVDLVIDENNPSNYFIDFDINRLTGNLPTDFYNNNGQ